MTSWASIDQAKVHWTDAAAVGDGPLAILLGAATDVCAAYAPTQAEAAPVPDRLMLATILQAREIWAASKRDGDVIGLGDGYALRSRPLTGAVKALLRPSRGVPVIG